MDTNDTGTIQETNSIFQQPWWLDAVAPGAWNAVTLEKGGQIYARLPYVIYRKGGLRLSMLPPFTQTLGHWIDLPDGKYATRLSREKEYVTELIDKLPKFDYFKQNLHYSHTNWLPYYWKGFEQTTRYTYVIDDISDPDTVWGEIKGNIRREIRKAQKKLEVRTDRSLKEFWDINLKTFTRQGTKPDYNFKQLQRLDEACRAHQARKIFYAVDSNERIHAVLYLIWDHRSAYYLMGGADPDLRNSGASSLLMWEAIKFASTVTSKFDFEGSMIEPIERFFRGFGAHQKRYFRISRMSRKMKLLKTGVDVFKTAFKV